MANKYTMKNLAEDVLKEATSPMSCKEIWDKAIETGISVKVNMDNYATTPVNLLSSTLNTDINTNPNTMFQRFSKSPYIFLLKDSKIAPSTIEEKIAETENDEDTEEDLPDNNSIQFEYTEAGLHPVLAMFVASHDHFKCSVKTIIQQRASGIHEKKLKNDESERTKDMWMYPDIIGVYFPFSDYKVETTAFLESVKQTAITIFSFELKKEIGLSNLRECYFQAVSNSSWANEGYLVASEIKKTPEFLKELGILNNSFGIGLIKLNLEAPQNSEIIINAKPREKIDIDVLNKLIIKTINDSITIKKNSDMNFFDKIYSYEEYLDIVKTKGLMNLVDRKK